MSAAPAPDSGTAAPTYLEPRLLHGWYARLSHVAWILAVLGVLAMLGGALFLLGSLTGYDDRPFVAPLLVLAGVALWLPWSGLQCLRLGRHRLGAALLIGGGVCMIPLGGLGLRFVFAGLDMLSSTIADVPAPRARAGRR